MARPGITMAAARLACALALATVSSATARAADETGESVTGTVFVFEEKDGKFVNTRRLMPKALCGPRSFGNDVSIDWPLVAVGRPKNERLGLEPGGAYVFDLSK
jgi:hypothetical protein